MSKTKISVIITAYNRKDFLIQAIESVINQIYDPLSFEIVVVTNFSVDLVNYQADYQLKSILMDGNIGEFLYTGIIATTHPIIAFLDDDDTFKSMKLHRLDEIFSENPKLCYYHNELIYVDINIRTLYYVRLIEKKPTFSNGNTTILDAKSNFGNLKHVLENRGDFNLSSIAIRRESYLEYLPLLKQIKSNQDGFFFWTGLISMWQMMIDDMKLVNYRVHDLNVSRQLDFMAKSLELQKQIYTYDLILSFLEELNYQSNNIESLRRWILLYKYEYELMFLVFAFSSRVTILKQIKKLLSNGMSYSNTLKYHSLLFAIMGFISRKFAQKVYLIMRHVTHM